VVEVRCSHEVVAPGSGRERFVLASLLLNADRLFPADRLIDLLWREPPPSAKAQLHNMISKLRRRIPAVGLIETQPNGYRLMLHGHSLDLAEFRCLVQRGREAAERADHPAAAELLGSALSLWRGPALADVPDELAGTVRAPLHEERFAAAEAHLDALLALGRHDELLAAVAGLLHEQPYRERLYQVKMLALAGIGRRGDALNTYRQAYDRLVEDLGVEPGRSLRELEQRILCDDVVPPAGPSGRLVPRQLPPTVRLQGRDKLVGEIVDALADPDDEVPSTALLVGQGGVGKTAIALAAAHALGAAFPDGQLYADLLGAHDSPADPHPVLGRFLRALGVAGTELPDDHDERIALYRTTLAGQRILIVLDDAASERQVRPLLPGVPGCAAVVTSRRQLGALIGVVRQAVPTLARSDAVALLARIAGRHRIAAEPDAATAIVDLCGQLPLAVCVAAARLVARPEWTLDGFRSRLGEVRGRLDELAVGDLDVRASIALSYHALDPRLRRLFRRLGLLATPDWPAWVAQELLGEPTGRMLDHLVDAHLVEPLGRDLAGQARYQLHDLVAVFATERAHAEDAPHERAVATDRLLSGWLGLAGEADELVPHGTQSPTALHCPAPPAGAVTTVHAAPDEWFQVELPGLVAAVELACQRGRADLAGSLALRLSGFTTLRAYDRERERVFRLATACAREHGADALLARLLGALYEACSQRELNGELPALAAERLALARRLGDGETETAALWQAGRAARDLGNFADATRWLSEAVNTARQRQVSGPLTANCLSGLANLHLATGHSERALPLFEESLGLLGDRRRSREAAIKLYRYAYALTDVGRLDDAERIVAEGLELTGEIGDDTGTAYLELVQATVDLRRGRLAQASERIGRSLRAAETLHSTYLRADALRCLGDVAALSGRHLDAVAALRQALQDWREIGMPVEVARTLARLERAATATGNHEAAAAHGRECRSILADVGLDDGALRLPPAHC
jgi:DNA-binding SARP family transcriptional activator/tetratricopeptide (TPR) repeat protein